MCSYGEVFQVSIYMQLYNLTKPSSCETCQKQINFLIYTINYFNLIHTNIVFTKNLNI